MYLEGPVYRNRLTVAQLLDEIKLWTADQVRKGECNSGACGMKWCSLMLTEWKTLLEEGGFKSSVKCCSIAVVCRRPI